MQGKIGTLVFLKFYFCVKMWKTVKNSQIKWNYYFLTILWK